MRHAGRLLQQAVAALQRLAVSGSRQGLRDAAVAVMADRITREPPQPGDAGERLAPQQGRLDRVPLLVAADPTAWPGVHPSLPKICGGSRERRACFSYQGFPTSRYERRSKNATVSPYKPAAAPRRLELDLETFPGAPKRRG
jgi:hypothetical protein